MYTPLSRIAAGIVVGTALMPTLASAQAVTTTSQPATTAAAVSASSTTPIGKAGIAAQDRAAKEIDRRIAALAALKSRVDAMARMSDTFKQALNNNVGNQIQLLSALKTKIAADTDLTTLKADVKSITEDYRIYALVIPQGHISAMADHVMNLSVMFQALGGKLQARVQAAAAAGNDTTAATKALTDLATSIVTAQSKAKAAMDAILPLQPDQGDKKTQDANKAALKQAHTDLQAAQQALVTARKDVATITGFLAKAKMNANANASTTTTTQTQ